MSQVASRLQADVRGWRIDAGESRQAPFPAGPLVRVVIGPAAGEPVGVLEVTMPVGSAMPEHDHGDSAVLLMPLAGTLRLVETGSESAVVELQPGSLATIPVGRRVHLENAGETEARTLAVLTPPDFAEQLEAWPAVATVGLEAETLAAALEREHREIDEAIEAFLASATTAAGSSR